MSERPGYIDAVNALWRSRLDQWDITAAEAVDVVYPIIAAAVRADEQAVRADERKQSHLVLADHTRWPDPNDPNEVQHRLRYGTPTREDLLFAASVMAAYGRIGCHVNAKQVPLLRRAARLARDAGYGPMGVSDE